MSLNTKVILAIEASILVIVCIVIAVLLRKRKKQNINDTVGSKKGSSKNRLYFLYSLYSSLPGVSKLFNRLKKNVAKIYPADTISINKKATRIMTTAVIIASVGTLFSWLITGNDIFYGLMGTYFSIILSFGRAKKELSDQSYDLYEEMVESIDRVNDLYQSNNRDVVKALQNAVYEIPYVCSLHFQKIHDILVSKDINFEMDKYRGTAPNSYMELFLAACSSVRSFGDKMDKDGNKTIFMKNLDYITEDIENEILALDENRERFRRKTVFCIAPLFFVKPIEIGAKYLLPNIGHYYDGLFGLVSLTVVFLVSLICYMNITSLRDGDVPEDKYNSLYLKLSKVDLVDKAATNIYNKNYTKYRRYGEWLNALGDYTGVKAFIIKRSLFAVVAFFMVIGVFEAGTQISKYTTLNSFDDSFKNSVAPNDEFRDYMEEVAAEYTNIYYSANYDTDEMVMAIKNNTEITSDIYATEIAEVVDKAINKYRGTYFKFYYLFIAFIVAVLAFNYPMWQLKGKHKYVTLRQDEEVSRFQTIILLLMHQDSMRVDIILEWLERFSYCFREPIADCSITYNYNKKKAVTRMKNQTIFKPFHSICDSLLNVDNVGIASAFSRIESDRLYSKDKRKYQKLRAVTRRGDAADQQALLPLYVMVGMTLIAPTMRFAFDTLQTIVQYAK